MALKTWKTILTTLATAACAGAGLGAAGSTKAAAPSAEHGYTVVKLSPRDPAWNMAPPTPPPPPLSEALPPPPPPPPVPRPDPSKMDLYEVLDSQHHRVAVFAAPKR